MQLLVGVRRREQPAELAERAMERDLDRVRPHADELADLPRGQVGAVAEGDKLALTQGKSRDRLCDVDPPQRLILE